MKAFKIKVPDRKYIGRPFHEIIEEKASVLGYWRAEDYKWREECEYILLHTNGEITCSLGKDILGVYFKEIEWNDFAWLNPDDVRDTDVVEMPSDAERNENTLSDLIRLMAKNSRDAGYAKGLLSGFILCFDESLNIRDNEMLKLCVKNANEFIDKAGDE